MDHNETFVTIRVSKEAPLRSTCIGTSKPADTEFNMARSINLPSNLQALAAAVSTIPGSNAIRVREGQTPTRSDSLKSLLFTLSLMTASQRKARTIQLSRKSNFAA